MGDRRNIKVLFEDLSSVFFYTHWQGSEMPAQLQAAMTFAEKEGRTNDEPYFARIIFSQLIKNHVGESTGFGIYTDECDPQTPTIVVDCGAKEIRVRNKKWDFSTFRTLSEPELAAI